MSSGGELHRPLRIALMGTRGVPARYGGFETAIDEVGQRLVAQGHDVTVYCRTGNSGENPAPREYLGMTLVHLPAVRNKQLETLSHTFLSALHAVFRADRFDAAVVCNSANAFALPLLAAKRIPVAVHVDGLEWRRTKWGRVGRQYYRIAEALSVRWADALIADAYGIERYYDDEFGARTDGIAYGAPDLADVGDDLLHEVGVEKDSFHLVVARFEPENHVDLIIEGYLRSNAKLPLVVVGSTPYPSEHSARIDELAAQSDRVRLLGGVWDQRLLDQLYAGALTYLHGHSVGGTNPSLLRAMGAATATIAYDIVFNREVAGEFALYAGTPGEFAAAIDEAEADLGHTHGAGQQLAERARHRYSWDDVAEAYSRLCAHLANGASQRGLFTGRRSVTSAWRDGRTPWIEVPVDTSAPSIDRFSERADTETAVSEESIVS